MSAEVNTNTASETMSPLSGIGRKTRTCRLPLRGCSTVRWPISWARERRRGSNAPSRRGGARYDLDGRSGGRISQGPG
jgi:hypothetical protein